MSTAPAPPASGAPPGAAPGTSADTAAIATPDWPQQARLWADSGNADGPLPSDAAAIRQLAWALKDLCHQAWNSAPQQAGAAAQALRRLAAALPTAAPPTLVTELQALADWTDGIALVTRGQMADALTAFDRARQGFAGLQQPDHAAQTLVPRMVALIMLGRHDEAAHCGQTAQRELLAQGDQRAAAKINLNLGSLQMRRDQYAEAAGHYRAALGLFTRLGDREHAVMADIGLGDALTNLGNLDDALRIYARARRRAGRHGLPVLEAMVEESVALLALARGRYREALAGLEASRQRYAALAMPQHLAIAEKQLGDAYLALRLLPEALALFEPALRSFEALDMPDDQAWTLVQRGRAEALLGQPAAAADTLRSAGSLFAAQDNRVGQAAVALARAELALASADPAQAQLLATEAAATFAQASRPDAQARAELALAGALLARGDAAAAGQRWAATLQQAQALQLLPVQVRCHTGLGQVALAQGQPAAATLAFEAAIEAFEDQREALPGDELRSAFLSDHLLPYQALLQLALAAHARQPGAAQAVAVLQALDRVRAQVLQDHSAAPLAEPGDSACGAGAPDPAAKAAEASLPALRARLNWLYRRVLRLDGDGPAPAALAAELRATEQALLEQARRQRLVLAAAPITAQHTAHHPPGQAAGDAAVAASGPSASRAAAINLPRLQASLGADGALVAYGVSQGRLLACVVTQQAVQVLPDLAAWPEVQAALQAAQFQIGALRHGTAVLQPHLPSLTARARLRLQAVHRLVWAPLAPLLAGRGRLVLVPHGQLGTLPFAALDDGHTALGAQHQLTLTPSVQLAEQALARQPGRWQRVLALGETRRLAHAGDEVRLVRQGFVEGLALVGDDAGLGPLRQHAGQADVLHLACHAQFRPDNPMFSALHLADGALTVEQVRALRLKPGLVVLSGCETGLAGQSSGDEAVGLVRAFLSAGAARVLASLWPVDDAVTAGFMASFYGALRGGLGPAAALQQAQADTRARYPHPAFWAAFALHGGW